MISNPISNESALTPKAAIIDQPNLLTRLSPPRRRRTTAKITKPSTRATASSAMINCWGRSKSSDSHQSSGWVIRLTASAKPSPVRSDSDRSGFRPLPHQPSTTNAPR